MAVVYGTCVSSSPQMTDLRTHQIPQRESSLSQLSSEVSRMKEEVAQVCSVSRWIRSTVIEYACSSSFSPHTFSLLFTADL